VHPLRDLKFVRIFCVAYSSLLFFFGSLCGYLVFCFAAGSGGGGGRESPMAIIMLVVGVVALIFVLVMVTLSFVKVDHFSSWLPCTQTVNEESLSLSDTEYSYSEELF